MINEPTPSLNHEIYTWACLEDPNLGARKTMEDYTIVQPHLTSDKAWGLFVILDGHGGNQVAEKTKEIYPGILGTLLQEPSEHPDIKAIINTSIEKLTDHLQHLKDIDCGSTFCGLLINSVTRAYYVINVGDSSLMRAQTGEASEKLEVDCLTVEHKVTNPAEKERVKAVNGIMNNRVGGQLLVTRAIGDFSFHSYGLTATPDIGEYVAKREKFLLIGSDGVWDAINPEQTQALLEAHRQNNIGEIVKVFVEDAKTKSIDNISLIGIKF